MPWFGSKKKDKDNTTEKKEDTNDKEKDKFKGARVCLVFDGDKTHNWVKIFQDFKCLDGKLVHVYQVSWNYAEITLYPEGPRLTIAPIHESEGRISHPRTVSISPDFVIVRNQPRGATPITDCRKVLYGLMMANVPSINSLESIYMCLERPVMLMGLKQVQKKLGKDKFPLIDITYYSSYKQMVIGPEYPGAIKVSHAHAGMGKIKVNDQEQFRDVATILAVNDDYCTSEKFIEPEYGFRIQKVDNVYCVMKKYFTGSGWKSHFGGSMLKQEKLTDEYKLWVDECAKLFGGLDILAIDGIHGKNGKDYIIELNDTAIGILTERWTEDSIVIAKLALKRMNSIYCTTKNDNKSSNNTNVNSNLNNNIDNTTKDN